MCPPNYRKWASPTPTKKDKCRTFDLLWAKNWKINDLVSGLSVVQPPAPLRKKNTCQCGASPGVDLVKSLKCLKLCEPIRTPPKWLFSSYHIYIYIKHIL